MRTEEQVYQRSIELEPRETEAVRVTRSVPFSFQSIRMTTDFSSFASSALSSGSSTNRPSSRLESSRVCRLPSLYLPHPSHPPSLSIQPLLGRTLRLYECSSFVGSTLERIKGCCLFSRADRCRSCD